jgi:glycosyltransferase involved in cell wall biosynthesis
MIEEVDLAIGNGQWAIEDESNRQAPIVNLPNNATGLLFESDNADELAEKMLWALEHPEEVKTIIHNAQAEVQKYSWNNVKQQLINVYDL